eukprot:TRINITY_DN24164_c0_g1_i1.p1 TRINITY_DN24164_c0_g1~~TRINITY_DN24164_c0_g1_i1.p1  ORF type:complete len:751 (-),score=48.43 TRINITY_DN24164_c0_g1_i1:372-2624(-)
MHKYRTVRNIGSGAQGSVDLVHHEPEKKQYVMKKVPIAHLPEKERHEAYVEANVLVALRHPNIITYKESFHHSGNLNIVMEFAKHGDLAQKISAADGRRFSEQQILTWFTQIVMALHYCHTRKILHRDLKTDNILLMDMNTVKLGDFGISKMLDGTYEMATSVVGTPTNLSPELIENQPYNAKSDIWALGCILFELCTLTKPFKAASMAELIMKIVGGQVPPIPKNYSPELQYLVNQCLQQEPESRISLTEILSLAWIQPYRSNGATAFPPTHTPTATPALLPVATEQAPIPPVAQQASQPLPHEPTNVQNPPANSNATDPAQLPPTVVAPPPLSATPPPPTDDLYTWLAKQHSDIDKIIAYVRASGPCKKPVLDFSADIPPPKKPKEKPVQNNLLAPPGQHWKQPKMQAKPDIKQTPQQYGIPVPVNSNDPSKPEIKPSGWGQPLTTLQSHPEIKGQEYMSSRPDIKGDVDPPPVRAPPTSNLYGDNFHQQPAYMGNQGPTVPDYVAPKPKVIKKRKNSNAANRKAEKPELNHPKDLRAMQLAELERKKERLREERELRKKKNEEREAELLAKAKANAEERKQYSEQRRQIVLGPRAKAAPIGWGGPPGGGGPGGNPNVQLANNYNAGPRQLQPHPHVEHQSPGIKRSYSQDDLNSSMNGCPPPDSDEEFPPPPATSNPINSRKEARLQAQRELRAQIKKERRKNKLQVKDVQWEIMIPQGVQMQAIQQDHEGSFHLPPIGGLKPPNTS